MSNSIVERLTEKRQIETAKSILESNGYNVGKGSKNLKESSSSSYTLEDLQRLIDLDEETGYELYLSAVPTSDDVSFAWDSAISVEGDRVIIQGGIAPGSDYDRSSVVINTSLEVFQRFYTLGINHTQQGLAKLGLSEEDQNFIWSICESY